MKPWGFLLKGGVVLNGVNKNYRRLAFASVALAVADYERFLKTGRSQFSEFGFTVRRKDLEDFFRSELFGILMQEYEVDGEEVIRLIQEMVRRGETVQSVAKAYKADRIKERGAQRERDQKCVGDVVSGIGPSLRNLKNYRREI